MSKRKQRFIMRKLWYKKKQESLKFCSKSFARVNYKADVFCSFSYKRRDRHGRIKIWQIRTVNAAHLWRKNWVFETGTDETESKTKNGWQKGKLRMGSQKESRRMDSKRIANWCIFVINHETTNHGIKRRSLPVNYAAAKTRLRT